MAVILPDANGASFTVKTTFANSQHVGHQHIDSSVLPTGAASADLQGALLEPAPVTDTGSSGLNGRLQRVAQRLSSLVALLPASLGAKAAASSLSITTSTDDLQLTRQGSLTETAPSTDIASSGLNGRLQRIAQRLSSIISLLPTALSTTGGLKVSDVDNVALSALVSGVLTNTDGLSTAVIAAQGVGAIVYLTDVSLTNSSAAAVLVEVQAGATAKWRVLVPAGGVVTHSFESPLAGIANTAWNVDAAAATTTLYASFSGFKV